MPSGPSSTPGHAAAICLSHPKTSTTDPLPGQPEDIDACVSVDPGASDQHSKAQLTDRCSVSDDGRTPAGAGCSVVALRGHRVFLAQPSRGRTLSETDRLRRHRAGSRTLPRRQVRGLPVGSRWADGCLGHSGRHRAVLQPDPRSRSRGSSIRRCACWASRRTGHWSRSGRAAWTAPLRRDRHLGSPHSRRRSRGRTWKARPSSTGRATARASSTTRPGPGIRLFVRDPGPAAQARPIFTAAAGLHGHFPLWSPEQRLHLFRPGTLPDAMDIWRIRPTGGAAERITHHNSRVSHPVFLDAGR